MSDMPNIEWDALITLWPNAWDGKVINIVLITPNGCVVGKDSIKVADYSDEIIKAIKEEK